MLPTLNGRLQTRIAGFGLLAACWVALITPLLGLPGPLPDDYATSYLVLLSTLLLGLGWELLYHLLQQFRWEKDWPTLFGLLTVLNEGALVWLVLGWGLVPGLAGPVPFGSFLGQFLSTWIVLWLLVNGPMRVPFVHWRFRGGRLI